jgi:hypothetical protein
MIRNATEGGLHGERRPLLNAGLGGGQGDGRPAHRDGSGTSATARTVRLSAHP